MPNPSIDAALTAEQIASIVLAIKTIQEQLLFWVDLSSQERRKILKMGRKAQTFSVRSLDMAT